MDQVIIESMVAKTETALDNLFKEWEYAHKRMGYERFIRDGIVSPKDWYEQSTPKICYLLKEAYTKGEGFNLAKALHDEDPWGMWKKVAVWTEAIFQAFGNCCEYNQESITENSYDNMYRIAVINVKKSNGRHKSDYKDIGDYALADRDFLRKEIEIINPDIIVCGYTSHCLRTILGDNWRNNNTAMTLFGEWDGKLVVDYFHPASHYPSRINYYALMSICQLALKKYNFLRKFGGV